MRTFIKARRLPPDVGNWLVLAMRLAVLFAAVAALSGFIGVPTEWLVGLSTVGGAAVGFASTRTVGNLIAGLYVLATRPFRVGDYVKVGDVEGIVEEITVNYTKIRTPGGTVVLMSNQKVLEEDVENFRCEDDLYCCTR